MKATDSRMRLDGELLFFRVGHDDLDDGGQDSKQRVLIYVRSRGGLRPRRPLRITAKSRFKSA